MSSFKWPSQGSGGSGSGTVTSVSVVTAHGLAGSVATATTTPAITLSTTITGVLKGNGTSISAQTTGDLTDAGTDGIIVTNGVGSVLGSGTSLAQHVADTTHNGYLSSTDWNTFNGKQSAGSYITALTGDGAASGPGSAALTLTTVNSNVGSFGSSTAIPSFTVNGKGLLTAASTNVIIAPAGTLTGTTLNSTVVTSSLTSVGSQAQALNMNSHLINNVTDPSAAQDAATKNYVDMVASGLQPIQAAYAATIGSNISGTYANGASGIGATFTTTSTSTFTIDGVTPPLLSRVLFKDQTSGFQNGVYNLTTQATGIVGAIFTRSLDYDTAGDMNAGNLIPIINGTVNALTSWLQTATITTVGSDSLVFVEWTANPANYLLKANNLSDVSSKSASFNNLSPMTTGGDIIYGGASGTGTRLANGSSGQVLTSNGTTLAPSWQTPSAGASISVAYIRDEKANTFTGGTFSSGSWLTRTLNTITDPNSIVTTLASNQFTLPSGTYQIEASAPCADGDRHQARLQDITNSATIFYGGGAFASSTGVAQTISRIAGEFVVSGSTVFEIQHQCQTTSGSVGFGLSMSFGNAEVYTQVMITKIA